MDLYIFRLDEGRDFRGVIVIFAADPPAVWRMLPDDQAEPVAGMAARGEAAALIEELDLLAPGARVLYGAGPLGQVFGDAGLTQGHGVTFVERDRIAVVGNGLSEASARGWVEYWHRRVFTGEERGWPQGR